MKSVEFYTFEDEVWFRFMDGKNEQLTEDKREVIKELLSDIRNFYPKAFDKLSDRYKKCQANIPHHQFMIAQRFCKCNFGNIDNVPDINSNGNFNLERLPCPCRGDCDMENIVCNPKFNSNISDAEMRVLELVYKGLSDAQIADKLCLSEHTVRNHKRNAYTRIGLREKAEFIGYAHRNKLFKD